MLSLFERIKTWWTVADPKQKVTILGGFGALLLVLVGTAFFVTRPHYRVLVDNLSDADQGQVVDALAGFGISTKHDRQGVVEVPESQLADARMNLANKLPKGVKLWTKDRLATINGFTDPDTGAAMRNTIRSDEIAAAIQTLPGVASAIVLVTEPKVSAFEDDKEPPTASVTITEDGTGALSKSKGRIIANLVCNSVQGMRPEGVTVTSDGLGELWSGKDQGGGDTKASLDAKVGHELEATLQAKLDRSLGPGNTLVTVRADVDTSKTDTRAHLVTPTVKPVSTVNEKESMQGGAGSASGPAGTASNTSERALAARPTDGAGKGNYDKSGKQQIFEASHTDTDTQGGTGDLKGLAIAVLVNSDKVKDASAVKSFIDGYVGGKIQHDASGTAKPDQAFTTTVTSVPFDGTAAKAAKEAADRQAGEQRTQQILSLLPIGAILIVALLVAKQVGRISKAILPAPPEPELLPARLDNEFSALQDRAARLYGEDGAAEQGSTDAGRALPERAVAEAYEEPPEPPEVIAERMHGSLESLKQVADTRPEMMASMIKSMLVSG